MNEIEKMYENAGIKPKWKDKRVKNTTTYYTEEQAKYLRQITKNRNIQLLYPPFTAEKQLEITKFLLKKAVYYDVKDDKYWFYYEECESAGYKPFDEAIAHFINKLWKGLTPEEKQQVKGILE